jgi:hypothetical protein
VNLQLFQQAFRDTDGAIGDDGKFRHESAPVDHQKQRQAHIVKSNTNCNLSVSPMARRCKDRLRRNKYLTKPLLPAILFSQRMSTLNQEK